MEREGRGERIAGERVGGENSVQQVTGTLVCQSGGCQDGRHASLEPCFSIWLEVSVLSPVYCSCVCVCTVYKQAAVKQGLSILLRRFSFIGPGTAGKTAEHGADNGDHCNSELLCLCPSLCFHVTGLSKLVCLSISPQSILFILCS